MAETRLADVIVPEIFTGYLREAIVEKSSFFRSNIIVDTPAISALLDGGGSTFNLPFWQDLTSTPEIPSETVAVTDNKITTDKQIALRQLGVWKTGSNDLSAVLAGDDPMLAIADYTAEGWIKYYQTLLNGSINGLVLDNVANFSSDLVNDIFIETTVGQTAANWFSSVAAINTIFKRGDRFDEYVAVAMHSVVYAQAFKNDLIDFIPDSQQVPQPTFMGLNVVVDDSVPTRAGTTSGVVYSTIFYKAGAFQYGDSTSRLIGTEVQRDEDKGMGIDYLHTRRHFTIHPVGFEWLSTTTAGTSPTYAELGLATNWNRVYDLKNTGFTVLRSNG